RQARTAGVLVDEEHAVPVLTAVGRLEHATLLLLPGDTSDRARVDDVRVRWMNDDAADAAGVVEAGVRPRATGVGRLVDAVADYVAVANRPRFAGPRPHDVGIRRCDRQRANRGDGHRVGHGIPSNAAVRRLPHAA